MKKIINRTMILILVATLFHLKVSSAQAATYYVDKTGSDSNNGSQATPWLTLQYAENTAANGDTVNVNAGTYTEDNPTTHGWNITKGISWIASGATIVKGTSSSTRPLYMSGTNTASFTGFTFDSETTRLYSVNMAAGANNKSFTNCVFKNATTANIAINGDVSGLTVSHSSFLINNAAAYVISATSGNLTNSNINNSVIDSSAANSILRFSSSGNNSLTFEYNTVNAQNTLYIFNITASGSYIIKNNTFNNSVSNISGAINTGSSKAGTLTITDNTFTQTSAVKSVGSLINVPNGTWATTISGNSFSSLETTQTAAVITVTDQLSPVITQNTIDYLSTGLADVINVYSTGTSMGTVQITYNTIKNRASSGHIIMVGTEGSTSGDEKINGAVIEHNTLYGYYYYNPSSGVLAQNHSVMYGYNINPSIKYNLIIGGGYGVVLKGNGNTFTSGAVAYNKLVNCLGGAAVRIKGISGAHIDNNTIYSDASLAGSYTQVLITQNNPGENSQSTSLRNNIFYGKGTGSDLYNIDSSSITNLTSNNNLFYLPSSTNKIATRNSLTYTFSEWKLLGYDSNSIFADPLFNNVSLNDFSLTSSSLAINAGASLTYTQDFTGASINGVPDIGALEFTGVTPGSTSSAGSSSNHSAAAPTCDSTSPEKKPVLEQITFTNTTATLSFTSSGKNTNYYMISYGYKGNAEQFGVTFPLNDFSGTFKYKINYLTPNKGYYVKIRGGNGCKPGEWSKTVKFKARNAKLVIN